jgi:hypothetical protein
VRSVAWLVALVGCSSAPAATTNFFGPSPAPPRGLAKLHPGMSMAEAKSLVPGLHEPAHKGVRDELVVDSGVGDVTLTVRMDAGTVASIVAIVQGHGVRDLLTKAWGEPEIARDSLGQQEVTWASERTGWKVKLDCLDRNCLVEYVPYHVLTTEYFGAHVVPPGDLAKLRIGMRLAEAKAVAPGPVAARAGVATDVDGVREFVAIDDKLGTVRSIYLNLPPHAEDLIAEAWGPGGDSTEPVDKAVKVWPDPETGWRATLRDALGYSHDLAFDNYLPAAQLFGDQPDQLDGLHQKVLGKTVDEIKKTYKDDLTIQGKELIITLPPTEWDRFGTRIELTVSGGHVHQISLSVPWRGHPEARDTLFELFKHKWGEPQEVTDDAGKTVLVFRDEDPHVEAREDKEHGAWQIEIR